MRLLPVALLLAAAMASGRIASAEGAAAWDGATAGGGAGEPGAPATSGGRGAEASTEGLVTRVPELVRFVEAVYPPDAASEGRQGEVLLEIEISAEGAVTDAVVVQSAGAAFDAAALAAVRQFVFRPAEIDGKPAPVRLLYRYGFVLRPAASAPPVTDAAGEVLQNAGAPGERPVSLRGTLVQRGTRDPLAGAAVWVNGEEIRSGEDGSFEVRGLAPGKVKIVVLAPGHERYETEEEIRPGEVTTVRYYVRQKGSPFEVVVKGEREKKEVAHTVLKLEELRRVPGTFGDAVRVVQSLPGVARTPFGLGPLVVRGGRPGDTRTYVDGHYVPILFHFGGLNSTVNGDLLTGLTFQPGNQSVRFGRSTGGIVDVTTRGGKLNLHGYAEVDLQKATLLAEGPLGEGSFAVTVRRSYLDVVLQSAIEVGQRLGWIEETGFDFRVAPRYYDYLARVDYPLWGGEVSFGVYGSDDELDFVLSDPQEISPEGRGSVYTHIGYDRVYGAWKRALFGGALKSRLSANFSHDVNEGGLGEDIAGVLEAHYLSAREDLEWRHSDAFTLAAGLDLLAGRFNYALTAPRPPPPGELFDPIVSDDLITSEDGGWFAQPGVWIEASWSPVKGLRLVPGLRFDHESYMDDRWIDPRLAMFYELGEETTLKAAAGRFGQPPQPPFLTKRFGNPDLVPEGSNQYALGVERKFPLGLSLDAQIYYKSMFDLAVASGSVVLQGGAPSTVPVQSVGRGESYGLEVLLRRELGPDGFFGWIAYSLSWSSRNGGPGTPWRHFSLDQRHNLTVVASWRLPDGWEVGGKLRYTSGAWSTPVVRGVFDADAGTYLPLPGEFSSEQLPAFFQADLRVDKRWTYETWILDVFLDVQNVTWRDNVEGVQYNHDFTKKTYFTGLPIFPSLGVRAEL